MEQIDPQVDLPVDPLTEFTGGNAALAEGRAGDAVAHYRRAVAAAPDVVEVHHNLAAALEKLQRWDEAAAVARDGLARRPDYAPLHAVLGHLLSRADGEKHDDEQRQAAREHYEQALKLDGRMATAWSGLAGLLMAQESYENALEKYHKASQTNLVMLFA